MRMFGLCELGGHSGWGPTALALMAAWTSPAWSGRATAADLTLALNGQSTYRIVISEAASETEKRAATELRSFFRQVTQADLPIVTDEKDPGPREIIVGDNRRLRAVQPKVELAGLGDEGFVIRTVGKRLVIAGARPRGTLYGVYTFLEKRLGCHWLSAKVSVIPKRAEITLGSIEDRETPALQFREDYYNDAMDSAFAERNKLNDNASIVENGKLKQERHRGWGYWCHTFGVHVPARKYFKDHPDYFALVDGKRRPDTQLCLTHPEVFRLVVADLRTRMRANPEARYWSVSQNDTGGNCQCSDCRRIDEREGTPMGSLLEFVNRVAAEFPQHVIATLSYQYTRRPPKTLRPAPNVLIMLCSIECNRSRPIALDPSSRSFREDVEGWSGICDNVFIWDYVVQFSNLVSPFPNWRTLQPNMQFFVDHHAKGMFAQGNREACGELAELRAYLLAKLMWDPACPVDAVIQEFLEGYYGAAAGPMRRYLDATQDALERSGRDLHIFGTPAEHRQGYLSPEQVQQYEALFDEAERLVADNEEVRQRVRSARMPLQYAELQLQYGTPTARKAIARQLFATAELAGLRMFNEWDLPTERYRQQVAEQLDAESFAPAKSTQFGAQRLDFEVAGQRGFVILPTKPASDGSKPWVWYAPTFIGGLPDPSHTWLFSRLLTNGFAICGVDVGESYGNPNGRAAYTAFHEFVVKRFGLMEKACLLPQSRGGLMLYNWAAEHPQCVQCIGGIYTVCDLASWPGLKQASAAYGLSEDGLRQELPAHNPIDRLAPLAMAKVPILHVHGDADTVVPLAENSAKLVARYRALGGHAEVWVMPGKGHEVCPEFFESTRLVDFLLSRGQLGSVPLEGQRANLTTIMPRPERSETAEGVFTLTPGTEIVVPDGDAEVARIGTYLAEQLSGIRRIALRTASVPRFGNQTAIRLRLTPDATKSEEGYTLAVRTNEVILSAAKPRGLFWGVQTLRQLFPPRIEDHHPADGSVTWTIPCLRIEDKPRFAWRGFMFDSVRSFATVAEVKRYIDLLAFYKMNVLNWHLTDDQGWRIQIKAYPKLTEIGAWRQENGYIYGGYYTQDEIRDVVAYAASRHVLVNPYLGMPAHIQALLPAFPELSCTGGPFKVPPRRTPWDQPGFTRDNFCAGNEKCFEFIDTILGEVIPLFTSPYVHIGFDERPGGIWENCSRCQNRMKQLGLKNTSELQNWFARRVVDFLAQHHRQAIGWEEILHGGTLPADVTSQSWLDAGGVGGVLAAVRSGHPVIVSPGTHCYLNFGVNRIDLPKVYGFEPVPPGLTLDQERLVLGGEAELWTDECPREYTDRMAFPRTVALAEALWTPKSDRSFPDFHRRLLDHYSRLEAMGVDYGESFWRPLNSWQAQWIWADDAKATNAFFKLPLVLDSNPGQAWLDVTAGIGYELYVNGQRLGGGGSSWKVTEENTYFYDQDAKRGAERYDVTRYNFSRYLRVGTNVLAIAGQNRSGEPGGVLAQGELAWADGRRMDLRTDGQWQASVRAESEWQDLRGAAWPKAHEYGPPPVLPWADRLSGIRERP